MKQRLMATVLAGTLATLTPAAASAAAASAAATAYHLVHSFGLSGAARDPESGVIVAPDGTLYGNSGEGGRHLQGTLFSVNPADGSGKVMYPFSASGATDGKWARHALVRDGAGNLDGVAWKGGTHDLGTVFRIDPKTYRLTVLRNFAGGADDGAHPSSPLLIDPRGDMFGTTANGGPNDTGTVFEISSSGTEKLVYAFGPHSGTGPIKPEGRLALDSTGHLYGITNKGGTADLGTVYKLTLGTGSTAATLTVLHSFAGGNDAYHVDAGVVLDAAQKVLYGTAATGGAAAEGIVYACAVDGSGERVVHAFQGETDSDGANPESDLTLDAAGMLYGTTIMGGTYDLGTVYALDPSTGKETVLHNFGGNGRDDGSFPSGTLRIDAAGDLVGTTRAGGVNDTGTIFALPR